MKHSHWFRLCYCPECGHESRNSLLVCPSCGRDPVVSGENPGVVVRRVWDTHWCKGVINERYELRNVPEGVTRIYADIGSLKFAVESNIGV